jgi:hypothetical protein
MHNYFQSGLGPGNVPQTPSRPSTQEAKMLAAFSKENQPWICMKHVLPTNGVDLAKQTTDIAQTLDKHIEVWVLSWCVVSMRVLEKALGIEYGRCVQKRIEGLGE